MPKEIQKMFIYTLFIIIIENSANVSVTKDWHVFRSS